jgi:hypothetical protein
MPKRGPQVGRTINQRLRGRLQDTSIDRSGEVEGMLDGIAVDAFLAELGVEEQALLQG